MSLRAVAREIGIAATSVNQVAKRVGLTRAAVYYYVKDGEDLVFQCYLRACQLTADDLAPKFLVA